MNPALGAVAFNRILDSVVEYVPKDEYPGLTVSELFVQPSV